MSLAIRVLLGVTAGFLLGILLAGSSSPAAVAIIGILPLVGTVFVNAIRMTVIPLVVTMLISSVGAVATSAGLRHTGMRALTVAVALLATAAIGSLLIAEPVLARVHIDQSAALAGRGSTTEAPHGVGPAGTPTLTTWLVDLVPPNVIKAAADGAMLPVILFAVLFGLALAGVSATKRESVLQLCDAIAETMQRLVGRILQLAPIGVFALAVPLATRLGLAAAAAVIAYIALVVVLTIAAAALLLYPLGILAGPMSAAAFVAYCAPAQAIAFASRSSLAALPAVMDSAERAGLSSAASRLVLPVAVTVFHFGTAVAQTVGVVFLARLFGVALTPLQSASVVLAVVLTSFAVPGIPGGSIIAMVPVLAAANLPLEGVGILLAVDTIPDMFRTTANLTGAMTLAAILPPSRE